MKTIGIFFVVLLILASLIGCTTFFSEPETAAASGTAQVLLKTASISVARFIAGDLVPLADAMQYDNTYTAVFKDGAQVYTFDFTSIDSPQTFDVPAGTYDILVLAGYTPGMASSKYLLGSGYVQNRTLAVGNNSVTITLLSIDAAYFLPPSVPSGGNLAGTLQVDLRNPLLAIGPVDGSIDTNSFTSTPVSNGAYTVSATAPTPSAPANYDVTLIIGLAGVNNLSLHSDWCVSDENSLTSDLYTTRFIQSVNVGAYTVTGFVTTSDTGAPVAGATVELYNNSTLEATVSTGADGRYVFGNVADSFNGSVKVSKSGYLDATDGVGTGNNQVNWWNNSSTNGNFALNPAAQATSGIGWGND